MQYVDTSVLVAYFVNEAHSAQAEQAMRDTSRYPLAISEWTETELLSALGIKCRTGQLSEEQSLAVQAHYVRIAGRLVRLAVTSDDFRLAGELLKDWESGLRSGDALHLAIAIRHGARLLTLCARKSLGTRNRTPEGGREMVRSNPVGGNPTRQRLATGRKRVLRCAVATHGTKRRQRVHRPRH